MKYFIHSLRIIIFWWFRKLRINLHRPQGILHQTFYLISAMKMINLLVYVLKYFLSSNNLMDSTISLNHVISFSQFSSESLKWNYLLPIPLVAAILIPKKNFYYLCRFVKKNADFYAQGKIQSRSYFRACVW